jgi:chemotaxis protein MotD
MSAGDGLAVRVAAAALRTAKAGAESQAEAQGGGGEAGGFSDVLSELAEQRRDLPQERLADATGAAKATVLAAALRQLTSADGGEQGPPEAAPDGQTVATDAAAAMPLPASLAEVAAVLSAPLPPLAAPAADAEASPQGGGAAVLARPQGKLDPPLSEARQGPARACLANPAKVPVAAAASGLRVLGRETYLAPAAGAGAALDRLATPTATTVAAAGAHAPTPVAVAGEEPTAGGPDAKANVAKGARRPPPLDAGDTATRGGPGREQDREPAPAFAAEPEAEVKNHPGPSALPLAAAAEARAQGGAAPLAPVSPLRQLAQQIAAEAAPAESGVGGAVPRDKPPTASVLRVLSIQLQPLELGTVSVRMTMRNDALAVEITAERQETARLLQRDRETLLRLLQANGFTTDSIQVLSRPADAPSTGAAPGWPQFPQQQQAGAGFAQPDARSFGKQGQAGREPKTPNQSRKADDEISSAGAGGSLYV